MKVSINKIEQVELDPVHSTICLCGNKVLAGNDSFMNVNMLTFSNSDNAKDAFCAILFAFDNGSSALEIIQSKNSIHFKC